MSNTDTTSEIPAANGRTTEFKTYANYLRARIADLGRLVQCFKKHPYFTTEGTWNCGPNKSDHGEMAANIVLSFRHLEDASMRLGKAIQAYDGGVSCYNADMGHGQEVPKPCEAVDAVVGTNAIDLKCSEPWIRDISGNQITDGAFKWLQKLAVNLGFTLGLKSGLDGRVTYHFYSPCCKVASFGEIKSVFCFLTDKAVPANATRATHHADALSWPAGETARPPFVQPPQAFMLETSFDEWARKKAHELGFQMSTDFNWGHVFVKEGTYSRHYKTEAEVRDFLTEEEKKRNDAIRAADERVKQVNRAYTAKPFTDESHSA